MSKKYLYIRHQESGCDYTIGCGVSIETITADSKEEAIKKIIDLPDNWKEELSKRVDEEDGDVDGCYSDTIVDTGLSDVMTNEYTQGIVSARLFEVVDETNVMSVLKDKLKEAESFKKELQDKITTDAERQQFEKLKKKFNK